ncbi:asparagine synthase (glutamine-hydrolysing) [Mucilaginibacter pineti]|uniref:asparagine synthase (glutamine-hydrolyzing) n=1 Tax=Mucilaginibacter pineti TaxID=1391627 RepID=A0A1G6XDX1_9SPHI|nr:asparagine synthase (glutamine-hydrolyzing) [Mucilaginibacter pineti]SDD76252.1 asparagine synthase (glutamine-hydrolysing) [Mucilaginibacter pineti]
MCGIYGSTVKYEDEIIFQKLARTNFRGPDYSGFERTGPVILGHNRLAIVDLDHRSNQPFNYHHLKIVFNGEIYNYRSLRIKLVAMGYRFTTDSDTEVIAAAFMEYRDNCVNHFNGMFAFVIYDTQTRQFFGARDRLGKKPFYYAHSGYDFEFASQPSQICIGRDVTIDELAINEYFIWGYVPEPKTAWNEIKKLEAGHSFRFDCNTGNFTSKKYWDLDLGRIELYKGSYAEAQTDLTRLISNAVDIRLHADVPLGVYLSGGIDSSLVAALAAKSYKNVKTFCIKFNEKGFDESVFAQKIAAHLQTDHHTITCNKEEGIELIEHFGQYYDEPFADPSAIPTLLLSKHTKKHVTVVLSGDGGDESFLGYSRYKWFNMVDQLFKCPLAVRKKIADVIRISPNYRHKLIALGICNSKISSLYGLTLGGLEYSWLNNPNIGLQVPFMDIWSSKSMSILQKLSAFDTKTYLNGDINTKVDRGTMAFSLEARAPLMDHRVVTFAQTLPDSYKFKSGVQKKILKDILYQHAPAQLFDRPKSGFSMPLNHWFKNELRDHVMDHLSISELQNIPGINVQKSYAMINEHMSGKWNRASQIWKLLVFSQWLKNQNLKAVSTYQVA